jgi:hypothetical protein
MTTTTPNAALQAVTIARRHFSTALWLHFNTQDGIRLARQALDEQANSYSCAWERAREMHERIYADAVARAIEAGCTQDEVNAASINAA